MEAEVPMTHEEAGEPPAHATAKDGAVESAENVENGAVDDETTNATNSARETGKQSDDGDQSEKGGDGNGAGNGAASAGEAEPSQATGESQPADATGPPRADEPVAITEDATPTEARTEAASNESVSSTNATSPEEQPAAPPNDKDDELSKRNAELTQKVQQREKELHAAQTLIAQMKTEQEEKQLQMAEEAKADLDQVREEAALKTRQLNETVDMMSQERQALKMDIEHLREERDEQARKEAALINRLNAAKKKEGVKANQAELYHDQKQTLEDDLQTTKDGLAAANAEIEALKQELEDVKNYSRKRIKHLESSLSGERKLNDERKQKMKAFVEAKTEEVRVAKSDTTAMQSELDQSTRSLTDLNQRLKQLHAQWVQSQTRNRELQRDIVKMKKDSKMMHKVGGTLEMKLSKSEQETEEHKNKRLTAKNELMAVLKQLESERDLNNRMRDSIKFTFTPKALSQQQTMREALDDLEVQMERVAKRFGGTLMPPPAAGPSYTDLAFNDDNNDATTPTSAQEANTTQLLSKLEHETQQVSQLIMTMTQSLERLDGVLSGPSTRSCVDALQDFLLAASATRNASSSSAQYGHVYADSSPNMT